MAQGVSLARASRQPHHSSGYAIGPYQASKRALDLDEWEIQFGLPALDGPSVATPLWPSVGVKPNTWKSWRLGVFRDSRMFRAQQQGAKHLALGCSWCHWKGLET